MQIQEEMQARTGRCVRLLVINKKHQILFEMIERMTSFSDKQFIKLREILVIEMFCRTVRENQINYSMMLMIDYESILISSTSIPLMAVMGSLALKPAYYMELKLQLAKKFVPSMLYY